MGAVPGVGAGLPALNGGESSAGLSGTAPPSLGAKPAPTNLWALREVEAGGETLAITPARVGEIPALIAAVRPLAGVLAAGEIDWLGLLESHFGEFVEIVALAARREPAWVRDLYPDEAIRLAAAVLEVNADFFVQRLVPEIERLALGLSAAGIGGTSGS
jgi:hypothetical protein